MLTSAEALVRWIHPQLGMISPGVFIPLFEENGLIQKLDQYV
jgi:EAL domain-containing protein (putative c-di-GMP-specific phosphodiesterase class I)